MTPSTVVPGAPMLPEVGSGGRQMTCHNIIVSICHGPEWCHVLGQRLTLCVSVSVSVVGAPDLFSIVTGGTKCFVWTTTH